MLTDSSEEKPAKPQARVLIVDHEREFYDALSPMASECGIQTIRAVSLREGIDKSSSCLFDVVLLKDKLPDGAACEVIGRLLAAMGGPEVIVLAGQGDPDEAEEIIRSGAWDYVVSPWSPQALLALLKQAIHYRREKLEKSRITQAEVCSDLHGEGIIGNSHQLQSCLNLVAKAALTDVNVLITGESGTGKELFASAIHNISPRATKPFVVVDCAALPETLVESILFGHEKGAFTGADKSKVGLLRQADGGTLFLDEVGELPLEMQKKFLRVLQERVFRPVGSSVEVKSDFRLIAATNKDLHSLSARAEFREDLLFRLQTFHLDLPPLRARQTDITELAYYFMGRYCQGQRMQEKRFSADFLMILKTYDWPGNVRELLHALERSIAAAQESEILYPMHLPPAIRVQVTRKVLANRRIEDFGAGGEEPEESSLRAEGPAEETLRPLQCVREEILERTEKRYLLRLINLTAGDIQESCRIAEISRSRLYALLKKYQIPLYNRR